MGNMSRRRFLTHGRSCVKCPEGGVEKMVKINKYETIFIVDVDRDEEAVNALERLLERDLY